MLCRERTWRYPTCCYVSLLSNASSSLCSGPCWEQIGVWSLTSSCIRKVDLFWVVWPGVLPSSLLGLGPAPMSPVGGAVASPLTCWGLPWVPQEWCRLDLQRCHSSRFWWPWSFQLVVCQEQLVVLVEVVGILKVLHPSKSLLHSSCPQYNLNNTGCSQVLLKQNLLTPSILL